MCIGIDICYNEVPQCLREHVLRLARDSSGHYSVITTCSLINFNFTWPLLYAHILL